MTYRALGQIPDPYSPKDWSYAKINPRMIMLPQVVDTLASAVKDQDNIGACVFHAIPTGMESIMAILNLKHWVQFSPLWAYYKYRERYGDIHVDSGAIIRVALDMIAKYGIVEEHDWPYIPSKFAVAPPAELDIIAADHQILEYYSLGTMVERFQCLASGFGFVCGIPVYENFNEACENDGIVPMPRGDLRGGHAIYIKGYNRNDPAHDKYGQTYKGRNSWGPDWGQNGDFYLPFEYLETVGNSFWTIRLIEDNP